ncbi:MAG: rhodanese-like domain-containing protein [Thermodesulfobacteriota bacterium]|nr:rhodanese-like domain-containing protein [Thermodesulfobacteriota bacterium]
MLYKDIAKELFILLTFSVGVAFAVNHFSPRGISFFGEWDVSKGVITAKSRDDVVEREIEIKDILEAKEIYDSGNAVFVDARSRDEYEEAHIAGAVSIPAYEFDEYIIEFEALCPVSVPVATYCSGRECEDSHMVAQYLIEAGYTDVRVFIDGYSLWFERGFPIEP